MKRSHVLAICAAASLLLSSASTPADASCNTIPAASSLRAGMGAIPVSAQSDTAASAVPAAGQELRYKLALGRIGNVWLIPGITKKVAVAADGVCVTDLRTPRPLAIQAIGDPESLVALLFFRMPRDPQAYVQAYGSAETCELVSKVLSKQAAGTGEGPAALKPLGHCRTGGVTLLPDGGPKGLGIAFPPATDFDAVVTAHADRSPPPLSVRVVVAGSPTSEQEVDALVARTANQACADLCPEVESLRLSICGDYAYDVAGVESLVDPVPCRVTSPLPLSSLTNDFDKLCEDDTAETDVTKCTPAVAPLKLWQDDDPLCGGVHIPFLWTGIRANPNGPALINREVAGHSATGRKARAENPAVWVPGREFVGSTPLGDPSADLTTTNWRWPEIDVWYPEGPEEFGLKGVVDQNDSIVHVFPRIRATLVCKGSPQEACMAVERRVGGNGVECACRDRHPATCACEAAPTARYFACNGGQYANMPCTRGIHCPGGTCDKKPICRAADAVWPGPGTAAPPNPSDKQCAVDTDCTNVAGKPMCGYRLFDVSDRAAASGLIELDKTLAPGGPRKGRGVCKQAGQQPCSNDSGPNKAPGCSAGVECRGYVLKARGKITP